jgi:hypothetical protein
MLVAALVIAGWVAAYLGLRVVLNRRCEDIRREFQDQVNMLRPKIRPLDGALDGPAAGPAPKTVQPEETTSPATRRTELIAWPAPANAPAAGEELSPEIMAVIAETVTGFLGKRVGIRSARKLSTATATAPQTPSENADPWAQQGRVLVQSSHQSVHARISGAAAQRAPSSLRGVVLENTDLN